MPTLPTPQRSPRLQARLLGLMVTAVGMAGVASAMAPAESRLATAERVLSPQTIHVASGATALVGLMLILVGWGVARRRRAAYVSATVLLVAATLAHVATLHVEAASATFLIVAVLVWRRALFVVPAPPPRLATVARVASALVATTVVYGLVGLATHTGSVRPQLTVRSATEEVAARLVGLDGPLTVRGRFGDWFPTSLTVLGALTLIIVLLVLLAPLALAGGDTDRDRVELALLLDRPDGDTVDPFILRRDKRRVFAPGRGAALGFRYVDGVGLASGDPVGDPAAFGACVQSFLELCLRHGWRPAVVGVREDRLPVYQRFGLRALYIGDEAIVDIAGFSLAGRRMRNARQAVNRSRNAGVRTEVLPEGDLDPRLRESLLAIAASQRGAFREFGYSMALGDLLSGEDAACVVVVCRDADGVPVAFQRYVLCRQGSALSLDVMRRRPDAPNGVNERMIVDLIEWGRDQHMTLVSLNFAAFRTLLDEDADLAPPAAATAWFLRRVDGAFGVQLDTLRRFNAKFAPRWVRRYLVYRSPLDLPMVGLAALSAEGFLPFDTGRSGQFSSGERASGPPDRGRPGRTAAA